MIEYIKGKLIEVTPTEAVVECAGIGYNIQISLQTYEALGGQEDVKIYIHHVVKEDDELYYGFATKDERALFRLLITVSGIGVGTARIMLSSLSCDEIRNAILSGNVKRIQSVKGIGGKTAQRLVIELQDKIGKGSGTAAEIITENNFNEVAEEAVTALVMLGYTKANAQKAINSILKNNPSASIETLIKNALSML